MKSHSLASGLNTVGLNTLDMTSHTFNLADFWQRFAKLFNISGLLKRLMTGWIGPVEPQIYQHRDRRGQVYFRLYDPKTDKRRAFSSEEDIRVWLDQRY